MLQVSQQRSCTKMYKACKIKTSCSLFPGYQCWTTLNHTTGYNGSRYFPMGTHTRSTTALKRTSSKGFSNSGSNISAHASRALRKDSFPGRQNSTVAHWWPIDGPKMHQNGRHGRIMTHPSPFLCGIQLFAHADSLWPLPCEKEGGSLLASDLTRSRCHDNKASVGRSPVDTWRNGWNVNSWKICQLCSLPNRN